jgi:translocation and assembly module TamB
MGKRRWIKRIAIFFGVLLLAAAAVIFTYPYWLGRVAGPVAERFGARFASFERLENGRFAVTDLVYTNDSVTVRASKLEGFLPHVWYQRKGRTNSEQPFLEVNGWKMLISPVAKEREAKGGTNRSVYARYQDFKRMLALGREWLPKATLLNGMVVVKGREYTLPLVTWEDGELEADGVWPEDAIPVAIKGKLAKEPYQISYAMHRLDLRARLRVFETNQAVAADVTGYYLENRVDLGAEFGEESGAWPRIAKVSALEFKLPAELLKLEKYQEVTGSLTGEWSSNRYTVSLNARAEPFGDVGGRPVVDIELEASGDTNRARVEKLLSTAPGLKLALSQPVEVDYAGRMLSGSSELEIELDLAKLPWGKLEGELNATVLLKPGGKLPVITFRARGTNLSGFKLEVKSLAAAGNLDWPTLEEFRLDAQLASNMAVVVSGGADFRARTLSEARVSMEGVISTNVLPTAIRFSQVKLAASATGAITNLRHSGAIEVRDFFAPGLAKLQFEASWAGKHFAFEELALRARAGPASLVASGDGYVDERGTNFTFRELTLSKGDEAYLSLAKPFEARVTEGPRVTASELKLVGADRDLEMEGSVLWPREGDIRLAARNIHPELFQFFVARSLRGLEVPGLQLAASWSNGPVRATAEGEVALVEKLFGQLRARVNARLGDGGLTLTNFTVTDAAGEVVSAKGFLPLSLNPMGTNGIVNLARGEAMDFELKTAPSDHFWGVVGGLTKLELSNPAVRLELRGTARNPAGELEFMVEKAGLRGTNRELPSVGPVSGRLTLDAETLRVTKVEALVEEQRLALNGSVELGTNFWTLRRGEVAEHMLDHASLRLRVSDARVAPFARFFPKYLAREGSVMVDARVRPGRELAGSVELRDLETRTLPKLGVIQEIQARVKLRGREVLVEDLSGVLGGQRLVIHGKLDFSEEHWAKGYPKVDFVIQGTNVPLARNPDVILRSDLDLRVKNGANMIPVIEGNVGLRDSFLLRDIATLVPGRVASPERRPPFFTVPQDPIDDWTLNVRVRGENFLRVRSPFFHGVASANFHVTGTLEEPMALGEAALSSGRVIFPFASLEIKQALVSLTSENPYLPRIFVTAAGRAFGFDVWMEAEGFADEPVIEFSSVPSLTSEQIILMLTTGQVPRDDFGFSREDRASKLAFFLGKSLWEKLNPGQPGEERLTIRSGQDITEQGKQTYEVEYKLSDRWSLVGEYDRFGALNANVKWRVFSR